jgi:superfamily II DNA helicase RecQ
MEKNSPDILRKTLKDFFGFDNFKGLQEPVIQNIFSGNDTFVIMPTGAGKSLCYQLPALCLAGTAIVISPLIALMKNQVDSIRAFSGEQGRIAGSQRNGALRQNQTSLRCTRIVGKGRKC